MLDFRQFEGRFREIGLVAREIRQNLDQSGVQQKSHTGDAMLDVVTVADYRLQKLYLELFLDSELRDCQLLAEESDGELDQMAAEFTGRNGWTLCLDPVDGTQRYVEGSPYYASIVSVRDAKGPIYSWIYYPALDWWVACRPEGPVEYSRPASQLAHEVLHQAGPQDETIVYTAGDPEKDCQDWMERLSASHLKFKKSREIGPYGAKFLLLSGVSAGYFVARPNPFDGLLAYHFAQKSGLQLWKDPQMPDFSVLSKDSRGLFYPFRYLALSNGVST